MSGFYMYEGTYKGDSIITRLFQNLNPKSSSVAIYAKVALLDKSSV